MRAVEFTHPDRCVDGLEVGFACNVDFMGCELGGGGIQKSNCIGCSELVQGDLSTQVSDRGALTVVVGKGDRGDEQTQSGVECAGVAFGASRCNHAPHAW